MIKSRTLPLLFIGAFLALAACAPVETRAPQQSLSLTRANFSDLQGWRDDRVSDALDAFRRSCRRIVSGAEHVGRSARFGAPEQWQVICDASFRVRPGDGDAARHFFEKYFLPHRAVATTDVGTSATGGLFTGYFEPELKGARKKSERYPVPLLAPPADLVSIDLGLFDAALAGRTLTGRVRDKRVVPVPARAAIDAGALDGEGLEILWLSDPVDAFFLHVQGSGRVVMEDGSVVHVGFAGRNGHAYTAIGRALIESGDVPAEQMSMQAIRAWIEQNPDRGQALMQQNASYIFFRKLDGDGPIGAAGAELTPGRSLAVDPAHIPFGVPLWLDTTEPDTTPKRPLRRLVVAQDAGAAIRGPVRGDLFWGFGADAARKAGTMKERGGYFLLLPRAAQP